MILKWMLTAQCNGCTRRSTQRKHVRRCTIENRKRHRFTQLLSTSNGGTTELNLTDGGGEGRVTDLHSLNGLSVPLPRGLEMV